jgi:hypothetical protein
VVDEVSAIQSTSAFAVQPHSRLTSTASFPPPPVALNATASAASVTAQRAEGDVGFAASVSDEEEQPARKNALKTKRSDRPVDTIDAHSEEFVRANFIKHAGRSQCPPPPTIQIKLGDGPG